MKIQLLNANGSHYAGTPQSEKRGAKRIIRFAYAGCSGYLLLRSPLEKQIDLHSETTQHALAVLGDRILGGQEVQLPQMEYITVRYISHDEIFRSGDCVEIRDDPANYAVCGVLKKEDICQILLPLENMLYTTAVAVELYYSVEPYMIQVRKGLFRKVMEQSDFYWVRFERKPSYVDGMVYYTIGRSGTRFPVTERMLGASVLIKTNKQIPEFHAATPGVVLKKK